MTEKIGNVVVVSVEAPRECQFCHKTKECRPYGPGKRDICHSCAMATPEMLAIVRANFDEVLQGPRGGPTS